MSSEPAEIEGAASVATARWRAPALAPERRVALRDSWRALWISRLLIWVAGVGAVLALGLAPRRSVFDPAGLTRSLGSLGNLLVAPAARWDAVWYLLIARFGYRPDLAPYSTPRDAFFPLYPLGVGVAERAGVPPVLAGIVISLAALAAALYLLHRLMTLEFAGRELLAGGEDRGLRAARLAPLLLALAPVSFFLSAVYPEALFLLLSVALFLCARRGRWAWVGVLGALAGATRPTGVLLLAPALILYLYGPRGDRAADREGGLRPRYRLRRDVAWLALAPAGALAYCAALAAGGVGFLAPLHAQASWGRAFAGPFVAVWQGAVAAFDGARQLLSGQAQHVYFAPAANAPLTSAGHNVILFAFLAFALVALVGVARTLPLAYTVYVAAALALPLSYPVAAQPLMSLSRFVLVLFPLVMWLAWWLAPRRRGTVAVLALSACALCVFTAQFATWHWVA